MLDLNFISNQMQNAIAIHCTCIYTHSGANIRRVIRTKHNCSAMMQPMIKNQAPGLDFVSENTMAQQVSELNDSQLPQHSSLNC